MAELPDLETLVECIEIFEGKCPEICRVDEILANAADREEVLGHLIQHCDALRSLRIDSNPLPIQAGDPGLSPIQRAGAPFPPQVGPEPLTRRKALDILQRFAEDPTMADPVSQLLTLTAFLGASDD